MKYLPLIKLFTVDEKITVNNHYLLLINLKNIIENYQRLIKIFTVNEYIQRLIKTINR